MAVSETEIRTLIDYCTNKLGDPEVWKTPDGYPYSLALCIIDSLYSTNSHYNSVVNVINRYRERYVDGGQHGSEDLLETIAIAGGPRAWAEDVVENVKPAHTRPGALLKAEIIERAARLMIDLQINSVPDLVAAVEQAPKDNDVYRGWLQLPSQSSGTTYNYLLMLAGLPSVKPDRMVLRFLADALGADVELSPHRAVDLITEAAHRMKVNPRALDHIVWRAASGRELTDLPTDQGEVGRG